MSVLEQVIFQKKIYFIFDSDGLLIELYQLIFHFIKIV